ncbi:hypothetical protein [Cupriavidus sp. DL-D2]|uniref:hypothetical protein n=1 Tax=Cupriavidus sp. DL-D2 TaxID=3144974 RepID=UPI00321213F0
MTWPIDIACMSRADRRLNADVADMAMKSSGLERENARLRAEVRHLNEAIETLRAAHAVASTEALQARVIVSALVAAAAANPHQKLGRWVRLGNMAGSIKRFIGGI